jgi:hypothetical protein
MVNAEAQVETGFSEVRIRATRTEEVQIDEVQIDDRHLAAVLSDPPG